MTGGTEFLEAEPQETKKAEAPPEAPEAPEAPKVSEESKESPEKQVESKEAAEVTEKLDAATETPLEMLESQADIKVSEAVQEAFVATVQPVDEDSSDAGAQAASDPRLSGGGDSTSGLSSDDEPDQSSEGDAESANIVESDPDESADNQTSPGEKQTVDDISNLTASAGEVPSDTSEEKTWSPDQAETEFADAVQEFEKGADEKEDSTEGLIRQTAASELLADSPLIDFSGISENAAGDSGETALGSDGGGMSNVTQKQTILRVQIQQSRHKTTSDKSFSEMVEEGLNKTADVALSEGSIAAPFIPGGSVLGAATSGEGQMSGDTIDGMEGGSEENSDGGIPPCIDNNQSQKQLRVQIKQTQQRTTEKTDFGTKLKEGLEEKSDQEPDSGGEGTLGETAQPYLPGPGSITVGAVLEATREIPGSIEPAPHEDNTSDTSDNLDNHVVITKEVVDSLGENSGSTDYGSLDDHDGNTVDFVSGEFGDPDDLNPARERPDESPEGEAEDAVENAQEKAAEAEEAEQAAERAKAETQQALEEAETAQEALEELVESAEDIYSAIMEALSDEGKYCIQAGFTGSETSDPDAINTFVHVVDGHTVVSSWSMEDESEEVQNLYAQLQKAIEDMKIAATNYLGAAEAANESKAEADDLADQAAQARAEAEAAEAAARDAVAEVTGEEIIDLEIFQLPLI